MKVWFAVILMFAFSTCSADVLALGLKTHHFSSPSYYDKCRKESHDLLAIDRKGYLAGTYINSHCRRSFLAGASYRAYGLGLDVVMVTGYPSKMVLIGSLIIIPQVTYSKFWEGYGVKLSYVPTVLIGVGFVYRI